MKLDVLSKIIVSIVSRNAEELTYLLEELILSVNQPLDQVGSHSCLHPSVGSLLLSDVFDALSFEDRARYAVIALLIFLALSVRGISLHLIAFVSCLKEGYRTSVDRA